MISPFCLFLLLAITVESNDRDCSRLSNGCKLKSYFCIENKNTTRCHFYVCDKLDLNFNFSQTEMQLIENCSTSNPEVREALNNVYFRLSKDSILDSSFDLLNNKLFLSFDNNDENLYYGVADMTKKLKFKHIKGFDIGTFKHPRDASIHLDFFYSNVDFYLNRSLIRSCEELENLEKIPQYIFNAFWPNGIQAGFKDVRFINCEYKRRICPLSFRFMEITSLRFMGIQNTFYRSNYPRFLQNSTFSNKKRYFLTLNALEFNNMQNIELNSVILDKFLFETIYILKLFGDIVSIEKGLFKPLKKLKWIELDLLSIRKLMQHGTDWLLDLNSDINIDLYNRSLVNVSMTSSMCVNIFVIPNNIEQGAFSSNFLNPHDYFPDEDFCLYAKFPFRQLIIMIFSFTALESQYSCTFLSIIQNVLNLNMCYEDSITIYMYLAIHRVVILNQTEEFEKCNFKQRLNNCNRSQFEHRIKIPLSIYDLKQRTDFSHLILIIIMPLVCLLGIISNSLVIHTVSKKSNKKQLKENQYKYMRLNAIFNILILLIEPLKIISECRDYNSLFCSRIRFWQFSQYFKIIFGEYFSNVFRLAANLTYVQFALNRLSLIGKDHGKLVTNASQLTAKQYIGRIVVPCLVLPVVKIFRYLPNRYLIEADYPTPIGYYFKYLSSSLMIVYMSFNIIFDILNYIAFLLVNFIIDLHLVVTLKQTLDEKKKNKSSSKSSDSKKEDNPVRRTMVMVILNGLLSMILKLPSVYASIFDLANFVSGVFYAKSHGFSLIDTNGLYNYFIICSNDNTCFLVEKFGNLLFLISLSIYLIFFYHFDKNFRYSFRSLFKKIKKKA